MKMKTIIVTGIVDPSDGRPIIELANAMEGEAGRVAFILDAHDAIRLALEMIASAERITGDALLIKWSMKKGGEQGSRLAYSLMEDLKEFRNQLEIDSKNRQESI